MDITQSARAAAGRRRFWITIVSFAIANLLAWVGYHQFFGPQRQRILRVDRFTPGDRAMVSARPAMAWQFNLDVADDPSEGPPATITPAVAGKWKWNDRRTLAFMPEQDFPRATRFTVTVPAKRLRTPEGFRMAEPFTATVVTTPLRVQRIYQSAFEKNGRYILGIEFNDRVIPADLAEKLSILGPDGKQVGFQPHGQAVDKTLFVITDTVTAAEPGTPEQVMSLTAKIGVGLAGAGGPLGLEQEFVQSVPIGSTLVASHAYANTHRRGRPEITIEFNGSVDTALLREVVSVEPAVKFVVNGGYHGIRLEGDFQAGSRYTVKFGEPPRGLDRKKYPCPTTLSVFVPDRRPSAWFEHDAGYLGSAGNRTVQAHTVNLAEVRVQAWRVYDTNLVEWRNSSGSYRWQRDVRGYAKPIAGRTMRVNSDRNVVQDLRISLEDLLPAREAGEGVYRLSISAAGPKRLADSDDEHYYDYNSDSDSCVVTLSDLALTAKQHAGGITVWATSLSTACPIERARVRVFSNKNQLMGEGLSDRDGVVNIRTTQPGEGESAAVILADGPVGLEMGPATRPASSPAISRGLTWMDVRQGSWDLADTDIAGAPWQRTGHEAFVYTDRGGYRPGDLVHLRAIVRRHDGGDVKAMPVRWLIRRPDNREWQQINGKVDAEGSIGLDLPLPRDLTTGRWTAELGLAGESTATSRFGQASFLVEEFVPNRLKATLTVEGKGLVKTDRAEGHRAIAGSEPLNAVVQADYLFGRPGAGLAASLSARLDPCGFSPQGWAGWTIGDMAGVIDAMASVSPGSLIPERGGLRPELQAATLDDKGHGQWKLDLGKFLAGHSGPSKAPASTQPSFRFRGPWQLAMVATVQETGGRSVSAGNSIPVDVLPWYIAIRRDGAGPARPGESMKVDIALIQPSGKAAAEDAPLKVSLFRESWNNSMVYRDGRYHYHSNRVLDPVADSLRDVQLSAGRGSTEMTPAAGGAYVVCVEHKPSGALTAMRFYCSNGGSWEDNVNREHPERLEVVVLPESTESQSVDRARPTSFKVGDRAKALVRSPFAGRLLFTVETDRVLRTQVIEMSGSSIEIPLDIGESLRPNAYVTASVIRAIDPSIKWRTHRAFGAARVCVDPSDHKLALEITSPREVRPLSPLNVSVLVTDPSGRPMANVPVTLAAVDEGILQLTDFHTPDPLAFFHRHRALGVNSHDVFGQLMPEVPRPDKNSATGGDGDGHKDGGGGRYRSPVTSKRIKPVALFAVLRTDEQGVAQTNLSVPEFAGRLRMMAVAHAGRQFGSGDRQAYVRSSILVQSSFPRFAAPGDRFTAPVTIFNNGPAEAAVTLSAQVLGGSSCLEFAGSPEGRYSSKPINIPAGGQHVMNLAVLAKETIGVAQIRLTASADNQTSQESIELPIRPASPVVDRGGYGVLVPGETFKVSLDDEFLPGTSRGSVTVTTMPTVKLPQGLEYLERYPYGCAEQTISTSFPLIYLDELGPLIAPGVFEKERIKDKVQSGIMRLLGMQAADGGLSMWPGSAQSWPWASVYCAHFLVEAKGAGHAVPDSFHKRLLGYLRAMLAKSGDGGELLECQAYACYVLALAGKPDRAGMNRLGELCKLNAHSVDETAMRSQARLHLALAWLASGRRDLATNLLPASIPALRENRQGGGNVGSPVRDRAMLLNTMLTLQPDNQMIPALVEQLAKEKWLSTQDTAFCVMAIGKYLRQARNQTPFDRAELALGETILASGKNNLAWKMPAEWGGAFAGPAARPAVRELLARIEGGESARGYLSWTRSGIPRTLPANEDHGITVRRRYLDERGNEIKNGAVETGTLVLVELSVQGARWQRNIVVEDLLPAGLEIENPRLATTATGQDAQIAAGTGENQRQLQNARLDMRDDRMILFGDLPESGIVRHVYAARAVVPGAYTIPPARAECMYDLGTNSLWGPGGTLRVEVSQGSTIVKTPLDE